MSLQWGFNQLPTDIYIHHKYRFFTMTKGYTEIKESFDLHTQSGKVDEKVVKSNLKKVYSPNDITQWIRIGVAKGFIENNKDVRDWIKLLKDIQIDL